MIGRFSQATTQDVDDAVAAAKAFQLEWDRMGWQERVRILRNVADIMEERVFDLAALMAYEVGKSRLEALGDVQETAELIRWNCDEMEKHDGFRTPMSGLGAAGDYYDVMRPHGVWAVISPFNFPMALSGGPSSGALVAGNTRRAQAVEPGRAARLQALRVLPRRRRAARARSTWSPAGAPSPASHLWRHPDVNGVTFTGSYPVGHGHLQELHDGRAEARDLRDGRQEPDDRHEERRPRQGDRRRAAQRVRLRRAEVLGVLPRLRGARGLRRLPVARSRRRPRTIKVGNPIERDVYLGPIINEPAHRDLRGGRRGGAEERQRRHRRPAHHRGRLRPRACSSSRPIVEVPEDSWIWKQGAVRAVRRGRRRSTSSTTRSRRRTTPSTG